MGKALLHAAETGVEARGCKRYGRLGNSLAVLDEGVVVQKARIPLSVYYLRV